MRTINRITILGYAGKDCVLNNTKSGVEVAGISIATSTKKTSGEQITQWHNCVAFGKTAELLAQFGRKGARMYVEGEMQYSDYEKDGVKMLSAKVLINTVSFIDFPEAQEETAKPVSYAHSPHAYNPADDGSGIPF